MSNLTVAQQFQEKIKDRIRQSIGELLPDEELAKIVAKGMHDAFFEKQERIDPGSYNHRTVTEDAWFIQYLRSELSKQVSRAVDQWMTDNADKVRATLDEVLKQGIGMCLLNALNQKFYGDLQSLTHSIESRLPR